MASWDLIVKPRKSDGDIRFVTRAQAKVLYDTIISVEIMYKEENIMRTEDQEMFDKGKQCLTDMGINEGALDSGNEFFFVKNSQLKEFLTLVNDIRYYECNTTDMDVMTEDCTFLISMLLIDQPDPDMDN